MERRFAPIRGFTDNDVVALWHAVATGRRDGNVRTQVVFDMGRLAAELLNECEERDRLKHRGPA